MSNQVFNAEFLPKLLQLLDIPSNYDPQTTYLDDYIDSLSSLELISLVDDELKVSLDQEIIASFKTLENLISYLISQISSND